MLEWFRTLRLIQWIVSEYKAWKKRRHLKKKMAEAKKRDPYNYD
jgi:hypothetical protein